MNKQLSFGSVSLVRQGEHRFYTLSVPSDVLSRCCFVISRDEDPLVGFQRILDEKRAREIATYIDNGLGTIPSSIVLSAQTEANLLYSSKSKTIRFDDYNKSFLIIDGQHRIYGFKLATTALRVPVVIYDNLSKRDETRLFIDINSKQKGVPAELLLDIKKLADYESNTEELLREIFDSFSNDSRSTLRGKLSASKKEKGKITRSVFNTALKPLVKTFGGKSAYEIYQILNSYFTAFSEEVLIRKEIPQSFYNTTVFRAVCGFFPIIAARVKDKYGVYNVDNFSDFLEDIEPKVRLTRVQSPGNAYKPLVKHFEEALNTDFTL